MALARWAVWMRGARRAPAGELRHAVPRTFEPPSRARDPGRWFTGKVRGRLIEEGWGATMGFPALVLDPTGPEVEVQVLESAELPEHWERLDEFEGSGYQRVAGWVMTSDDRPVHASIYVLAGETPATRAFT